MSEKNGTHTHGHQRRIPQDEYPEHLRGDMFYEKPPPADPDLPIDEVSLDDIPSGKNYQSNREDRDGGEDGAGRENRDFQENRLLSPSGNSPSSPPSPPSLPSLPSLPSPSPLSSPSSLLPVIEATLPTRALDYKRKLFELARRLRATMPHASKQELRPVVQQWHCRATAVIGGTKGFAEVWPDFLNALLRVKFPADQNPLDIAFARARRTEPPAKVRELYPGERPIQLLAAVCREMQLIAGAGQWFYLTCRDAGTMIGAHHTTAWKYLLALCEDGILRPGEKGTWAAGKPTGKASRFLYIGD